jgi:hypothetical protein
MADLVRRYGRFPYNQLKYGLDTPADPLFGLVVDFENDGFFTGRNEATRLQKFTAERGRQHWVKPDGKGFEEEMIGRFSATIADPEQIYNPYNPASPLYQTLDVNRMLQLSVRTAGGSRYKLFTGTLTDLTFTDGVIPEATFSGSDGWEYLRSRTEDIQIPVQGRLATYEAIDMVLKAVNWRWGLTYGGYETQPHGDGPQPRVLNNWFVDGKNAAKVIFDLVFSEMGMIYIAGDGSLRMECRAAEGYAPIATISEASIEDGSLELSTPWENRRNYVVVTANPRGISDEVPIWSSPDAIQVAGNGSMAFTVEFKYEGQTVPAISIVDPLPVTDFQANTMEDGSGTDVTNNFTFLVTPNGLKADIVIYNNGGAVGYLLAGAQIRGVVTFEQDSLSASQSMIYKKEDKTEFVLDYPYYQDFGTATSDAYFLAANMAKKDPCVRFVLKPNSELQFKIELGSRIILNTSKTGTIWRRVAYIKHDFDLALNQTRTTIYCEPLRDIPVIDVY